MFFMNAFFVPLFWLINPFQLIKLLKRKFNYGKRSLTQGEAHKLMEDSEYEMGKRYAEIIETMWFTFLYSTLVPIGAFISVIGIGIYYWVDKYNLLRRSSFSSEVQGKLVFTSMNLLDFTLVLNMIGSLLFDRQIRKEHFTSTIVLLSISVVYLLCPKKRLFEKVYP